MPRNSFPLFGTVAILRFDISLENDESDEGFLYSYAAERRSELQKRIRDTVREEFGPSYEISNVTITPGSVTIMAALGAIGTVYVTISQYDDFLKGVGRLTDHLRRMFARFFGGGAPAAPGIDVIVVGSWQPHPTALEMRRALIDARSSDLNRLMIWYLILSNAALLGTFVWLLLRHFK